MTNLQDAWLSHSNGSRSALRETPYLVHCPRPENGLPDRLFAFGSSSFYTPLRLRAYVSPCLRGEFSL